MANRPRSSSPLAGFVSEHAERLYERLRQAKSMSWAQFDSIGAASAELVERGLVLRCGVDDAMVRPVEIGAALRELLRQEGERMLSLHQRLLDGWDSITASPPAKAGLPEGFRHIVAGDDVAQAVARLSQSARRTLRICEPPRQRAAAPNGKRLPAVRVRPGVEVRLLCPVGVERGLVGAEHQDLAVRARKHVPIMLIHADSVGALVAFDWPNGNAMLIHVPEIVRLLGEWFDNAWNDPSTLREGTTTLDKTAHAILRRMAYQTDGAIAAELKISIATVRRHVRQIYDILGVTNRFAAGMAATRLGWI